MDTSLQDLIRRTKDNIPSGKYRNADVSHVVLIPQQQFLTIRRDLLSEFWEGYCDLVYKGKGTYSIAEINEKDMPVIASMTFQFNRDNLTDDDIFTDRFLAELIYAWQQAIIDKLHLSPSETELICLPLESEICWQEGNSTLFQVRLHFPLCKTESKSITKIREKAISILRRRNALKELKVSPENDWDKIVDPHAHLEPLLLYKSISANGRPMMTLTAVYGKIDEDHLQKELVPIYSLDSVFDPRAHTYIGQGLISEDIFESDNPDKDDPFFWLPLILSVKYSGSIVLPKTDIKVERFISSDDAHVSGFTDTMSRAQYFLQFLSQNRAVDDFSWRDVGRALYTSSEGTDEGLEVWIKFTEQSDHFTAEDCELAWRTFENDTQVTYKTLAWYAKKDAPEEYKAWHESYCNEALDKALQLHHNRVAEYIYRLYWLEIASADADRSIWYVFNGQRWMRKQKTVVIAEKINKEIIPKLEKLRIEISQKVHNLVNHAEKQPEEARIKAITKLIEELGDQRFISLITRAAIVPFNGEYERFLDYADSNPNLVGCADCVIEADDKGISIRQGKPEDYVTMTTGVYLKRHKYHWDHHHVKEVMDWLKKVHTDSALRHEFLKECASWIRGRNIEKRIPIWTGGKNNSKSMIIRVLELAFYQYFGKFPTSIFTGRRTQSSGATPELARSKGKHAMIVQETDEDTETFRKGIMKELSGNDTIFARLLHDNGGEFLPMFKLAIVCNKIPRFIGNDPAIKERVRIVPFLSTWTDDAPESIEEQFKTRLFKKDPHFEIRLPMLAPAFLWVLIQYYPKYIAEGLKEPAIVTAYTKKYWDDQDYFAQYIEECISFEYKDKAKTEPDERVGITHTELFRHFKGWLADSMTGPTVQINSRNAKEAFEKQLLGFENKRWIGVHIVRDEDVHDI